MVFKRKDSGAHSVVFGTMDKTVDLYKQRKALETKVNNCSAKLNKYASDEPLNLLSDKIRMTETYKQDKHEFDICFLQLQQFNQSLTTKEKRQLRDMKRNEKNGQNNSEMD